MLSSHLRKNTDLQEALSKYQVGGCVVHRRSNLETKQIRRRPCAWDEQPWWAHGRGTWYTLSM